MREIDCTFLYFLPHEMELVSLPRYLRTTHERVSEGDVQCLLILPDDATRELRRALPLAKGSYSIFAKRVRNNILPLIERDIDKVYVWIPETDTYRQPLSVERITGDKITVRMDDGDWQFPVDRVCPYSSAVVSFCKDFNFNIGHKSRLSDDEKRFFLTLTGTEKFKAPRGFDRMSEQQQEESRRAQESKWENIVLVVVYPEYKDEFNSLFDRNEKPFTLTFYRDGVLFYAFKDAPRDRVLRDNPGNLELITYEYIVDCEDLIVVDGYVDPSDESASETGGIIASIPQSVIDYFYE